MLRDLKRDCQVEGPAQRERSREVRLHEAIGRDFQEPGRCEGVDAQVVLDSVKREGRQPGARATTDIHY
jgi:hypothetical protein